MDPEFFSKMLGPELHKMNTDPQSRFLNSRNKDTLTEGKAVCNFDLKYFLRIHEKRETSHTMLRIRDIHQNPGS
jgi:hypothetical protein